MNKSALGIMFLFVCLAGGFALWQNRSETETQTPKSPLEKLDYSSIRRISCSREDLPNWSLIKHGASLDLVSPAIADGRPVAGNPEVRSKIVGFLQDARWQSVQDVADMDLEEWGLQPPLMTIEIEDGSGSQAFEVGKPDMNGDVYLRAKGGQQAFKYPARVVTDLGLEVSWYRDPKLADIPSHMVDEIHVNPAGAPAYAFRRLGISWMIDIDGGPSLRADSLIADQLTVTLANLSGTPLKSTAADSAEYAVRVVGNGRECKYEIVSASPQRILARRGDEPDLREVDPILSRFFVKDPTIFEDQSVIGLDAADLRLIELSGTGRSNLQLGRNGDYWRLLFGSRIVRPVDPEAFRNFRELLLTMKSEESKNQPESFQVDRRLRFDFDADLLIPALVVDFSPAEADGSRWAKRSDHDRYLRVGPTIAAVLETQYSDLMVRYLGSTSADTITKLGLVGPDGRGFALERKSSSERWRVIDATQDGATLPDFKPREIPNEFCQILVDRLAQFSVAGYLGEKPAAELAQIFEKPRYRITWSGEEMVLVNPEDPLAPRMTEDKYWEIGARLDDDHLLGRMSAFPALVFPVRGDVLLPVTDTLRLLSQ